MSGKSKEEFDREILFKMNTNKKIVEFEKEHGKNKYFVSRDPQEIIYYSQHILELDKRLKYFDYIFSQYMKEEFGEVYPDDDIHRKFCLPILEEYKIIENNISFAMDGKEFEDYYKHFDIIKMIARTKNNIDDRISFLIKTKEKLNQFYSTLGDKINAKKNIDKIIKKVDKLLVEAEKDKERLKFDINGKRIGEVKSDNEIIPSKNTRYIKYRNGLEEKEYKLGKAAAFATARLLDAAKSNFKELKMSDILDEYNERYDRYYKKFDDFFATDSEREFKKERIMQSNKGKGMIFINVKYIIL